MPKINLTSAIENIKKIKGHYINVKKLYYFKRLKKEANLLQLVLFFLCLILNITVKGQQLSSDKLLATIDLPIGKLVPYLHKNGFSYQGKNSSGDTILNEFHCKNSGTINKPDSADRFFCRKEINQKQDFIYETTSLAEFTALVINFKAKGFICHNSTDNLQKEEGMLQYHHLRLSTFCTLKDGTKTFCLQLQKDKLPIPKNIKYADDLLAFTSAECLQFYFGKENVVEDNYYFFDNEIAKCSVLFINTQRQVVYIWEDQKNSCGIRQLLFGGQPRLESSNRNNHFVAENKWVSKSGLQAGMPLVQLRKLNGDNFKFQSGVTPYFGTVMPDNTGKINFKRECVILSCINCKDEKFLSRPFVSADEAIADDKIFFVLALVLNPL